MSKSWRPRSNAHNAHSQIAQEAYNESAQMLDSAYSNLRRHLEIRKTPYVAFEKWMKAQDMIHLRPNKLHKYKNTHKNRAFTDQLAVLCLIAKFMNKSLFDITTGPIHDLEL